MPIDPKDPTAAFIRNMVDLRRFENTVSLADLKKRVA